MAIGKITSKSLAADAVTSANLAPGAVTISDIPDSEITADKLHTTLDLSTKTLTLTQASVTAHESALTVTQSQISDLSTTSDLAEGTNLYYTDARADARAQLKIDALVGAAPSTLDTLNELAAALGDDANFSTTITNSIATKLPLAGGTMTGDLSFGDNVKVKLGNSNDTLFYHNTNTYFENFTGNLYISNLSNDKNIQISTDDGSGGQAAYLLANGSDGSVTAYHYGNPKLATTSTGIDVTGSLSAESISVNTGTPVSSSPSAHFRRNHGAQAYQQLSGLALYWNTSNGFQDNTIVYGASTNSSLKFTHADGTTFNDRLIISSSGNVGIGTTTPSSLLHLYSAGSPQIRIQDSTNNVTGHITANDGSVNIGTISNHAINFTTNNGNMVTLAGTNLYPTNDNSSQLGLSNRIWSNVWTRDLSLGNDSTASNISAKGDVLNITVDSNDNTGGAPNLNLYVGTHRSLRARKDNVYIDVTGGTARTNSNDWLINSDSALEIGINSTPDYTSPSSWGGIKFRDQGWGSPVAAIGASAWHGDGTEQGYGEKLSFFIKNSGSANSWNEIVTMRKGGNVGIGTSSPSAPLHVYRSNVTEAIRVETGGSGTGCKILLKTPDNGDGSKYIMQHGYWTEIGVHNNEGLRMRNTSGNIKFQVTGSAGNCTISGSLSKGSGSFKIDHPLDSLSDTHDLVHSFIEGPQADLIYRGKVQLVNGQANVNIDTASNMTVGTFEVLCRDVQCFTSNETGWTAVKGSVTDNILSIIAQDNTCTDTISWMVVGERKDPHMYDTEWTDSDGKIIVEPLKVTEEDQLTQSIAYHEG